MRGREDAMIGVMDNATAQRIVARLASRRGTGTVVVADPLLRAKLTQEYESDFPAVSEALLLHAVQVAFITSTRLDEGRALRFSLSLVPRRLVGRRGPWTHRLDVPLELEPDTLRKLAPIADLWSTCILVDEPTPGRFEVWGVWALPTEVDPNSRTTPTELVVRATAPANVHVALWGERVWSLERAEAVEASDTHFGIVTLTEALGGERRDPRVAAVWSIVRDIERRGHGGTLAICPAGSDAWSDGHAVRTAGPTITAIVEALRRRRSFEDVLEQHECPREPFDPGCPNMAAILEHHRLRNTARAIGGMANVDGAVVLAREDLRVLAFAARLRWARECSEVFVTDAASDKEGPVRVTKLGGMRHRSAAHWVQGDAEHRVAIVVSSDGLVTLFYGAGDEVHAFRPLTQGADADLA